MSTDFITLFELNKQVKQALKKAFPATVWITAEITSVQENRSGHCYLELADKPEGEEKTKAVARATIWSFTYGMLRTYFTSVTGRELEKGMKILVNGEVVFHEVYGFSLNIKDIDPTFTIGDLERKRREIIERLEKDGVFHMNKELDFPLLPKNIAVISSPTAAGYGDFLKQLHGNSYSYKYHVSLFPAVMQGEQTTDSIIAALERIYEYEGMFDVVVIIRGGGSQTELGAFDSYDLAAHIAQFPIPVIAGIGHERDETIVDLVAYASVKTPTAAAAFLIECFQEFEESLNTLREDFVRKVRSILQDEYNRQDMYLLRFKHLVASMLESNGARLNILSNKIGYNAQRYIDEQYKSFENFREKIGGRAELLFSRQNNTLDNWKSVLKQKAEEKINRNKHLLELAETKVKYVDPQNVLERGYSITRINGQAIKNTQEVNEGDMIETILRNGKLQSEVKKKLI